MSKSTGSGQPGAASKEKLRHPFNDLEERPLEVGIAGKIDEHVPRRLFAQQRRFPDDFLQACQVLAGPAALNQPVDGREAVPGDLWSSAATTA